MPRMDPILTARLTWRNMWAVREGKHLLVYRSPAPAPETWEELAHCMVRLTPHERILVPPGWGSTEALARHGYAVLTHHLCE